MGGFWGNVSRERIGKVIYNEEMCCYIVEWIGGKNQNYVRLDCDIAMDSEILGNITENPELLK